MDEDSPFDICTYRGWAGVDVDAGRIRDAVTNALRRRNHDTARISVALVDDAQIAALNKRYLGRDGPTDVLAFDLSDSGGPDVEGQVVLSTETAAREARARGHDPTAEILLYAIHGTLHLSGMTDATDDDARTMHEMEDDVLTDLGIGPIAAGGEP